VTRAFSVSSRTSAGTTAGSSAIVLTISSTCSTPITPWAKASWVRGTSAGISVEPSSEGCRAWARVTRFVASRRMMFTVSASIAAVLP